MADQTFVDPITELPLGPHAFGVVSAGTASAEFEAEHRYRWGFTGAGHYQTAYVLYTSTDGGLTWSTTSTEFTLQVIEALNPGNDPLFMGQPTAEIPTSRLDVAPLRSGCGYKLGIKFQPSLRTGAARETINWKLGVLFNETYRTIALIPDAPTGILTGLGDITVSEWVTAPTLTNGTDEVTLGTCDYIIGGVYRWIYAANPALSQDDVASAALASGEEYVAVLSANTSSGVTTTKGVKALAGAAVAPAYPAGELPLAVVRVPYGGVIVTSTLLAVSGRCLVSDTTGLVVTVQPGRAVSPGFLATPSTVQTLTLADDATSTVYLSPSGVANVTAGIPLATVVCAGGDITLLTDARRILWPEPIRLAIPGVETVLANAARVYIPYQWTFARAELRLMTPSAGASGATDLVVRTDGIYEMVNDGITANSDSITNPFLLQTTGGPGWITLECDGVTTGGTPAEDVEVLLWIVRVA